jgi:hypothetical protein
MELTRAVSEAMVNSCEGKEVDEAMNEEFFMDLGHLLQTTPVVHLGNSSRRTASFDPFRLGASLTLNPAVSTHPE